MKSFKDSLRKNIPYLQQQKLNQLLFRALQDPNAEVVSRGKTYTLEELLEEGAEVDYLNNGNETPLMWIAKNPHKDEEFKKLKILIRKGAKINLTNKDGDTALMTAAENGNLEMVQTFIAQEADVSVENNSKKTALVLAVENGYKEVVEALITKGATFTNDMIKNIRTPLDAAIENNNSKRINTLIQEGIHINSADENGFTPLMQAIKKSKFRIAELLIKNGADVNLADKEGQTALSYAIKSDNVITDTFAKLLIEKGADVNVANKDGLTPLMETIISGKVEKFKILTDRAETNIHAVDKNGNTALMYAIRSDFDYGSDIMMRVPYVLEVYRYYDFRRDPKITNVKTLIEKGADIYAVNNSGNTAWDYLRPSRRDLLHCYLTNFATTCDKLYYGEDYYRRDHSRYRDRYPQDYCETPKTTALVRAAKFGNEQALEAVINNSDNRGNVYDFQELSEALRNSISAKNINNINALIKKGATVNCENRYNTLLQQAVGTSFEVTEVLINNGAYVNSVSRYNGDTALLSSFDRFEKTDIKTIEILLKSGADVNTANRDGLTPLMRAIERGNSEATHLLVNSGSDVNAVDKFSRTPLRYAIAHDPKTIAFLVQNGVDINTVDTEGKTALIYAVSIGKSDAIKTLIEQGAGLDSNILNQSRDPKIRDELIINAALNKCSARSNWKEIQIGLSNSVAHQDAVSPEIAAFLAATLPAGGLKESMFGKLNNAQEIAVLNFIDLKTNPDVNCLTEIQQNKIAAFKLGLDSSLNNATYLAAILPEGDLQKEIIQEYNDKNPENNLNQEKINALRCFAYGVGETEGFTTKDGKIDYLRAGEVVNELIISKNALNDLTMMLDSRLEMEKNFRAAIENATKENSEIPEIPKKDWVIFDSFLTEKIQSYCHKKDSVFNNIEGLKIFRDYMAEHENQQESDVLPTSPSTTTEHPISQTLKKPQEIEK